MKNLHFQKILEGTENDSFFRAYHASNRKSLDRYHNYRTILCIVFSTPAKNLLI